MPIEIKIYTLPENGNERAQIDAAMEALGFVRHETLINALSASVATLNDKGQWAVSDTTPSNDEQLIAEYDERNVADGVDAAANINEPAPEPTKRTRKTNVKKTPAPAPQAISTGDERVGPEDEQDAADEAADPDNAVSGDALTHEDLRKALADYSKKHGMKAAVAAVKADGIIGCTVDQVPVERIADVISDLVNAGVVQVAGKEHAEEVAAAAKEDYRNFVKKIYEPTKDGLMKAMLAYALKYDGTDDVSKASMATMPATMTDAPLIFAMRFGEAVNSLSKVPTDGYAQAILDVQEATEKNPFKREVK